MHKLIQVGFLSLGTKSVLMNGVGALTWELSKESLWLYSEFYMHKDRRMGGTNEGNRFRCLTEILELDKTVEVIRKPQMASKVMRNPSHFSVSPLATCDCVSLP